MFILLLTMFCFFIKLVSQLYANRFVRSKDYSKNIYCWCLPIIYPLSTHPAISFCTHNSFVFIWIHMYSNLFRVMRHIHTWGLPNSPTMFIFEREHTQLWVWGRTAWISLVLILLLYVFPWYSYSQIKLWNLVGLYLLIAAYRLPFTVNNHQSSIRFTSNKVLDGWLSTDQ